MQAYQSSQVVLFISSGVVPCPGKHGAKTVNPASFKDCAHGAIEIGEPIKP